MNLKLFENSKIAAYYLWEYTQNANAMKMWYCGEDIACFFENNNLIGNEMLHKLMALKKEDVSYIHFIRNIAYRVYVYTGNNESTQNWYCAERLITNSQWCRAIMEMASIYRHINDDDATTSIYSDQIKRHYQSIIKEL